MDVSRRRPGVRTSVVAGSVWETRMKVDEVKGGIKVFNSDDNSEEPSATGTKLKRNSMGGGVVNGKRKTWKSEGFDGFDKSPIHIAKGKSDPQKNSGDQCKELSVSADGIKRSPVQMRKLKLEGTKEVCMSAVNFDRSPIRTRKQRSKTLEGTNELSKEVAEPNEIMEKSSLQLNKAKSDSVNIQDNAVTRNVGGTSCKIEQTSVTTRKSKSESVKVLSVTNKGIEDAVVTEIERIPVDHEKTGSDETCKEFGVCQEKVISCSSDNVGEAKNTSTRLVENIGDVAGDEFDEEDEDEEVMDEEIEICTAKKSFDIKQINKPEVEADKVVNNVKKFNQVSQKPPSISLTVKKPPPIRAQSTMHRSFSKINSTPYAERCHSFPQTHNKLQSLVDLIMWRDVSRSAFVFMIGSFTIVSSSYVKDVNVSVISVMSYMGLVYLAAIFLYRSLICRGAIDVDDKSYVLGEEESIWVLKLVLPYLNEFLSKLKALFSGDPSTTMKLAVLLFILARCGSSITIWKMAKFGFLGVFTIPKLCTSYSAQFTEYAKFWVRRFRDAWDSCTQKKGVGIGVFILVWNLSSVVARIWAAFMLYVAFRYYQQNLVKADDGVEVYVDADTDSAVPPVREEPLLRPTGRRRQWQQGHTFLDHEPMKVKKSH